MEYERIHKVQTGIISPSKLRMKLMGNLQNIKKSGSNNNSSRTSPTKLGDSDFVKDSLLNTMDADEQVVLPSLDVLPTNVSSEVALPRDNGDANRAKSQQCTKGDGGNLSAVYPVRITEDENLDYDSNASSSSFEFHKGEKSVHKQISRVLPRSMPSKWNDAEKWIMNKQIAQANFPKKNALQNPTNRLPVANMGRVAPESSSYDYKHNGKVGDTKRVDFHLPASHIGFDNFCFVPLETDPVSGQACGGNAFSQSNDLNKDEDVARAKISADETSTATSAVRSVSMRDMGTEMTPEMTPIASQEPSSTCTPIGATTPIRSPSTSIPSTPRGAAAPAPTPTADEDAFNQCGRNKKKLSEEEQKMKTRREIVELGVQLGKMNIAAWASKAEQEKTKTCAEKTVDMAELERVEFEKHAAAWEEVEKSKHMARYKSDELEIQAWESEQKAKLEAELQRIEAKVEQVRAQAQSKLMKKIALARQRSEAKRAAAEARKVQNAEKTAAQAEYIRQTGRMPPSHHMCCGGWLSCMKI